MIEMQEHGDCLMLLHKHMLALEILPLGQYLVLLDDIHSNCVEQGDELER